MEVMKYFCDGMECVLIGYEGYFEVEGIMGQYDYLYGGGIYLVEMVVDVVKFKVYNLDKFVYVIQIIFFVDDIFVIIDVL